MGFLRFARKWEYGKERDGYGGEGGFVNRWSDCGRESCVSWMKKGNHKKLHVVMRKLPQEKSVISPYQLRSFHLVAHSMGCIIAVALAAKYSKFVKSVTLVAPPYFPSAKDGSSTSMVLKTLAGKTLWPPLAFGESVMSWELNFMAVDLTRHTHHSAWHSRHNVICGGAKFMDDYLEILNRSRVKVCIIHGDQDLAVPLDCSNNIKMKFQEVALNIIQNADHGTRTLCRDGGNEKSKFGNRKEDAGDVQMLLHIGLRPRPGRGCAVLDRPEAFHPLCWEY
ncbi:hypothetical protein CRYUN_Cryun16bG0039900 [Craigia yunnanensis]